LPLDFAMPERLGATYVGEDGGRHRPVMLHRAILGSMERFIGILIEHYAGSLPLWLAPVQVVVASITDEAAGYADEVASELRSAGMRVIADTGNETIAHKVREHSLAKVPLMLVVGRREAAQRTLSLRRLGSPAQEALALIEAIARLKLEAAPPG
jgi:threonyl-tRNA synthetase